MCSRRGVRTRACRVETRLDAWLSRSTICEAQGGRRDESRRGTHECVRHILVFLTVPVTVLRAEPNLSNSQKQWALATTAIRASQNGDRHDILGGQEKTAESVRSATRLLHDWWRVDSREDLLAALETLARAGHRARFEQLGADPSSLSSTDREARFAAAHYSKLGKKSLVGWDYTRYIALCRWGYLLGYLSEQEAWDKIMPAARLLQRTFSSWQDLGRNYMIGREF